MARIITIDSFGSGLDSARYDKLLENDKLRHTFTAAEMTALDGVAAILVDKEFFQIYRQDNEVTDTMYIPEGRYVNYWLYYDGIFSTSPFANALAFVPGTPAVSAVAVFPTTYTATAGQYAEYVITASVTATGFADENLIASITGTAPVQLSQIDATHWKVQIADTIASGQTATITFTSRFDSSKTATHTISVGA